MSTSARSYVAAGLVTAMAGPAMIGLMTAQGHVHLPNFSSASVALSSAETALPKAQMAVASLVVKAVADAEKVRQMAHGDSASVSPAALPAAAAASTPDAKTGTLSVLANAARAVHAAPGTRLRRVLLRSNRVPQQYRPLPRAAYRDHRRPSACRQHWVGCSRRS